MENDCEKYGLAPIVCGNPKFLVLGTLPGDKSLKLKQYYSKSSNRFWKVVSALCDCAVVPDDYDDRKKLLKKAHIALWDVYKKANRKGALDNNIKNAKINNLNEILKLLQDNPSIDTIVFNGKRPSKVFSEVLQDKLKNLLKNRTIEFIQMPSTSGANTRKTDKALIEDWKEKLRNI